jgi:hypothetical protein
MVLGYFYIYKTEDLCALVRHNFNIVPHLNKRRADGSCGISVEEVVRFFAR